MIPSAHAEWSRRRLLLSVAGSALLAGCGGGLGGDDKLAIKAATYLTPSYKDIFPAFSMFMNTVTDRSGDRAKFDWFHSETLLSAEQLIPGLLQGNVDVVFTTNAYVSSSYPVLAMMELPFVTGTQEELAKATRVGSELYQLINKQLARTQKGSLRFLASMVLPTNTIWTVDRPVRTLRDLQGLRIRTAGAIEAAAIKAFGAASTTMSSAELFEALKRGTIDGMVGIPTTLVSRDLLGVIKYGTLVHLGHASVNIYVRRQWFDQLPQALKSAVMEGARAYNTKGTAKNVRISKQALPEIEGSGIQMIEVSEEERRKFRRAAESVIDKWRKNFSAPDIADKALSLLSRSG